jgi:hypothetical protein
MKSSILLLAFVALAFSSCTSAYKTGQTPDDVYYSPVREQDEYVAVDKKDDRRYEGSEEYYEDRYLRYRARSPYRWSTLDDYYFNTPYAWHYGSYYGGFNNYYSPYSSYHCWNNYYNPYYPGVIISNHPGYYSNYNYRPPSRPVAFNIASYNSNTNTRNSKAGSFRNGYNNSNSSRYNNTNSNSSRKSSSSLGNSVRRVFSSDNSSNQSNGNSNSSSTPSRSYNPSSSSSSSSSSGGRSSSSSSGSSGGSISRPNK